MTLSSSVNPFRIIQNRLEGTREESWRPSNSVPRAFPRPNCSSVLLRASPRGSKISLHSETISDSEPHCPRSLRGYKRTRTRLRAPVHQQQAPVVTHGRDSTVWSIRRFFDTQAGYEAGLFFIATLGRKQRPRRSPWGGGGRGGEEGPFLSETIQEKRKNHHSCCAFLSRCLLYPVTYGLHRKNILTSTTGGTPKMAKRQDAPLASVPQAFLQSMMTHVQDLL